jgi:hypothetical protein
MTDGDAVLAGLPGEELVRAGLADLASGALSPEALLIAIARPRLRRQGVAIPAAADALADAELALYRALRARHPSDAYSRYNALLRRLVRFERALEARVERARRAARAGDSITRETVHVP